MGIKPSYLCCALLLASACSREKGTITFEEVNVERTVALSNDKVPPTCSVNLHLARATDDSGQPGERINETVTLRLLNREGDPMDKAAEAFAEAYTDNYRSTLLPLYNQDRADLEKRPWYHYHYIVNVTTHPGSRGTTVYLADINYQEGGDHAVSQLVAMNFETATGRLIALDDIFVNGYEHRLSSQLLEALKVKTRLQTMKALHAMGYLRTTNIYPPANFILGEEAVTFVYNPDEIAPYTIGAIQLTIPYAQLDPILNPNFER